MPPKATLEEAMRRLNALDSVELVVGQLEKSESGKLHGQLYVELSEVKRGPAALKIMALGLDGFVASSDYIRVMQADGSAWENRVYCTKNDSRVSGPWFFGREIKDSGSGQGRRSDLEAYMSEIRAKRTDEEILMDEASGDGYGLGKTFVRYNQGLARYRGMIHHHTGLKKMKVLWFWGPTGTSKTRDAYEACEGKNFIFLTGPGGTRPFYCDKYRPGFHEVVIFDDLRPGDMQWNVLLQRLDVYPISVDCRGCNKDWLVDHIIITSCVDPSEFAPFGEDPQQLIRRISTIVKYSAPV